MYGGKFAFQKLVMARKFTIFPLFYFVLEGKFQAQPPRGGLYSEGRFNRGSFALQFCGGSFSEFYGIFKPREAAYQSVFFYVINNMRVAESERRNLNLKNPQVWC